MDVPYLYLISANKLFPSCLHFVSQSAWMLTWGWRCPGATGISPSASFFSMVVSLILSNPATLQTAWILGILQVRRATCISLRRKRCPGGASHFLTLTSSPVSLGMCWQWPALARGRRLFLCDRCNNTQTHRSLLFLFIAPCLSLTGTRESEESQMYKKTN